MSKYLDLELDECIDRINSGESIEECLTHYPEHALELEPLLVALGDAGDICSGMPKAKARSLFRQRLDSVIISSERDSHKKERISALFSQPRVWAMVAIILVLAIISVGLYSVLTPEAAPVIAQTNFRLLLSDEPNAIDDFSSLQVTISRIGVLRGGEGGGWEEFKVEPAMVVDLARLQGFNAQEVWKGNLPEGQYRQVYIYIEYTVGTLKNGNAANVVVPNGNLQISKPFAVTAGGSTISFVYDVTVVASGGDYVLLPQLDQSGATEKFHELVSGELTVQVIDGIVAPGETITVRVTSQMTPVPSALVTVNDEKAGTTDEIGIIAFEVPSNDELEIEAVKDEAKVEFEIDLERESGEHEDEHNGLTLEVISGEPLPGKSITLLVTAKGNPLADALVIVNDREIGTTGSDGRISFIVADVEKLEIEAVKGVMKGDLEIDLEGGSDGSYDGGYEEGESEESHDDGDEIE